MQRLHDPANDLSVRCRQMLIMRRLDGMSQLALYRPILREVLLASRRDDMSASLHQVAFATSI